MENRKREYVCPASEAVMVRVEGMVCQTGGKSGDPGRAGAGWRGQGSANQDYYDYGDL